MEPNDSFTEQETLGSLFRKMRLERSLDISDIADETRIPPNTVRAIEADDYDSLPAHAFARGFYTLYGKMLGIDQDEVLRRYSEERGLPVDEKPQENISTPSLKHKHIGSMAQRPTAHAGSMIGFSILVLILAAAGICWYIGYNPAPGVSKWLRGLQESPPTATSPESKQIDIQFKSVDESETKQQTQVDTTDGSAKPAKEIENSRSAGNDSASSREGTRSNDSPIQYLLVAEFSRNATATVTIDKNEPVTRRFSAGSVKTWKASKSITLETERGTVAKLTLNDISIPVPESVADRITISIPEYLLDANGPNQN